MTYSKSIEFPFPRYWCLPPLEANNQIVLQRNVWSNPDFEFNLSHFHQVATRCDLWSCHPACGSPYRLEIWQQEGSGSVKRPSLQPNFQTHEVHDGWVMHSACYVGPMFEILVCPDPGVYGLFTDASHLVSQVCVGSSLWIDSACRIQPTNWPYAPPLACGDE